MRFEVRDLAIKLESDPGIAVFACGDTVKGCRAVSGCAGQSGCPDASCPAPSQICGDTAPKPPKKPGGFEMVRKELLRVIAQSNSGTSFELQ